MKDRAGRVATAGTGVLFLAYVVPIMWLIVTSLKSQPDLYADPAGIVFRPTLDAYAAVMEEGLLQAAWNSFVIALGSTLLLVVLGAPAAFALSRVNGFVATAGLAGLIILQMVPLAATVIPLYQILARFGLLSQVGVILTDCAEMLPFGVLLLRPFFAAVPIEVEEAAQVDGASRLRVFLQVTLPLARNGVVTVACLAFILIWGEFLYAITFISDPTAYPLSALLSQQISFYGVNWPQLMALSVAGSIPILLVFLLTERRLQEGLAVGSVK